MSEERLRTRPGFVRFWTASTAAGFGSYVSALALQVLVVQVLEAGATGVGLVNAARWLPYLLFGIVAGVLVDRARRRPVLVGADVARALLLTAVPALALTGYLSVWSLMVAMALFGLMSLLHDAASQSYLPRLVPGPLLVRANARLDQSDALAQTTGPVVAGALVSILTAPWAMLVDAATRLVSAFMIARIPIEEAPSQKLTLRGVGREAREGLGWLYRHRTLGPQTIGTHAWFLFNAAAGAVLAPYVLTELGLSAFTLGLVLAIGGTGALLGSLSAVRLGTRFGAGRVAIASMAVNGVGWAIMAIGVGPWAGALLVGLGQAVLGYSMGTSNPNEMGYRQVVTPDHLQGRTNATARSINRAMVVVGAPVGGLVGDAIGFQPVLLVTAVGFVAIAAILWLTPYRGARLEERPEPGAGPGSDQ
ncbi:MFS transporter [Occultella glacieicola]|uniref:MFS transporter n=1 Tax=Occultella glacieicola TaxID=2518684 RepID=A0ABY2E3M7_9MICO|nr:MFS transporter [Occultella glacieicola]TDE90841.1 MFS transporter [Occultella glacieicola]